MFNMHDPCLLIELGIMGYMKAWSIQKMIADLRYQDELGDCLILVEHPHTYTLGRRGKPSDILVDDLFLKENDISVYNVDRGGEVTYHGPGQVMVYSIFDVRKMGGAFGFVNFLEEVTIGTLAKFGVDGTKKENCTGIWIGDAKIAFLGLNIRRGITTHGFALNINTDLTYYKYIISCGVPNEKVTSLSSLLGVEVPETEIIETIKDQFALNLNREVKKVDLASVLG
jgi:lipoate-protein ligase B